ncbi:TlpA disulfide reductase family protein [Aestuariivivens sediminis]|uniref:TlpA disulfide reductase family protein n=1 Tax=Aestuariivivens sediminis TaxID=2913557 RepID=UPI001F57C921|nr:TlpA disulfide reductase family protein [Aestuariivivens sediminis]
MRIYVVVASVLMLFNCNNVRKETVASGKIGGLKSIDSEKASSIELEVYNFSEFEKFLTKRDDTIYVINFWATWCAPCVKELPHFEKLNNEYGNKNVKVILVSLDFPHLYESKLKPFIVSHKIKSKVVALDDPNMNSWIPKVDSKWSGSIPATVIYKNNTKKFFEQSFTYDTLENELKPFLN